MKKLLIVAIFATFSVSAQTLIVKKPVSISKEELRVALLQFTWHSPDKKVSFDDSYVARMQAYRDTKNRSRSVNGSSGLGGGMPTPLMIPILWGTFD